ncbi:MAG: cation transporter [Clostridia bacterium]|nr:cation transporter [Clostridia bacterium]
MTSLLLKLFIKNSNDTANPTVRRKYVNLGSAVGAVSNILLFIIKMIIFFISGSISVMADAFNNLSDIGSSAVTAIGYRLSEKPADKEHPFGHGRLEYMSAMVVAVLILLVGFELLKTSFDKIFNPEQLRFEVFSVIALAASVIIKFWMFLFNRKIGKKINSAALVATAQDSVNDCVSTTAVLASHLIFRFAGINIDPYIGVAVAIFILYSGIKTIKDTLDPLLGMPPEKETIDSIVKIVLSNEEFVGIHDLIVHNYGPGRSFASLHVEVPADANIVACHEDIDACEKRLQNELGIQVVIHMDPIAVNDENTQKTKESVVSAILKINSKLSLHDFRMVDGEEQINLIFDVVVPSDITLNDSEIKAEIQRVCKEIDSRYMTVITIDRDYISAQ